MDRNSNTFDSPLDARSRFPCAGQRFGLFRASSLRASSTTRCTSNNGWLYQCLISTLWTWRLRFVWFDFFSFLFSSMKKPAAAAARKRPDYIHLSERTTKKKAISGAIGSSLSLASVDSQLVECCPNPWIRRLTCDRAQSSIILFDIFRVIHR